MSYQRCRRIRPYALMRRELATIGQPSRVLEEWMIRFLWAYSGSTVTGDASIIFAQEREVLGRALNDRVNDLCFHAGSFTVRFSFALKEALSTICWPMRAILGERGPSMARLVSRE